MFTVLPGKAAVYHNHSYARRRLDGILESCAVDDLLGVEKDQIGISALADDAASGKAELSGGEAAHAPHGLF
jgi:hypothetical protein